MFHWKSWSLAALFVLFAGLAHANATNGSVNPGAAPAFTGKTLILSNDGQTVTSPAILEEYDSTVGLKIVAHGTSAIPFLQAQATRGTRLAPTHLVAGDALLNLSAFGYGTTGVNFNGAQVNFVATEDFTDTNSGSEIDFYTCAKLGVGCLNTMSLNDNGSLRVTGRDTSSVVVGNNPITEQVGTAMFPSLGSDTNDSASTGDIDMIQHGSFQSSLVFGRSRGTHASPTVALSGDTLGEVSFRGWNGAGFAQGPFFLSKATEDFASGHFGSQFLLDTIKNANGGANAWIFDQDGSTTLPGTLIVPSTITEERDGADPSVTLAAHATSPFNSIPRFQFKTSRGTAASPTAIQNGDLLGSISMSGYNGTLYQTNAPSIFFTAMENWSVGHNGAEIDFASCAIGNSCPVTMTLQTDGKLSVPAGIVAPVSGAAVAFTTKTSGTTITLTSTTHSAYVVACGAGGGGGGTTTAAASAAAGGGGAAGACVGKRYTGLTPSASLTIAIGTAGTAGTSSGGDGGLGGDSTFSDGTTVITGKGGNGGKGETAGSAVGGVDGGAGVIGTLGDWNGAGAPGTPSMRLSGLFAVAGTGGSCAYGAGGAGSGATGAGAAALGRCSGGAGGNVENNSAAVAGGAGTGGVVLVWEYQ